MDRNEEEVEEQDDTIKLSARREMEGKVREERK